MNDSRETIWGSWFPCLDDVALETRTLLQNLGVPELTNGGDRSFTAVMRGMDGAVAYETTVTLRVHRSQW